MLKARFHKHVLKFRHPAGTSRGVMHDRETWFLQVWEAESSEIIGMGECSLLRGLSYDDRPGYEEQLEWLCTHINTPPAELDLLLTDWPSIRFGLEMALKDLSGGGNRILFPSSFTQGKIPIPINGLVWMGSTDFMLDQISHKLEQGYRVIKMKVGAIDFESECMLLGIIRQQYSPEEVVIRLDANGAFTPGEALEKLKRLSAFHIHSIEQPIAAGQPEAMAHLCSTSPIPVALDEELIGVNRKSDKGRLLEIIHPQFIILKPSLTGGFAACEEWIAAAEKLGTGWWITSALESNMGLNAIAQWTATLGNLLPQGLGTGSLFSNNVESPLHVEHGYLHFRPGVRWNLTHAGLVREQRKAWYLNLKIDGILHNRRQSLKQAEFWVNTSDQELWLSDLGHFLHNWYSEEDSIRITTSGSTGEPKEVKLLKTAMIESARATIGYLQLSSSDDALLCLSVRYIAGMMMVVRAMVSGMNLIAVKPDGNPMQHLSDGQIPGFAAMVPAQLYNCLDDCASADRVKQVRTLIIGGGGIHPDLERQVQDFPNSVYATYGMTETITHVALRKLNGPDRRDHFTVLPGVEISLDERGCLVIRAPRICPQPIITNDMAEVLSKFEFRFLGRHDHIINRGGKKIIPEQAEQKLSVIIKDRFFLGGFPDIKFGQVPVLIIETAGLEEDFIKSLQDFMEKNLEKEERPGQIFFLDSFVEAGNGKVNRKATVGQILTGQTK